MDIVYSDKFKKWLKKLKDPIGYQSVLTRLAQIEETGELGDFKVIKGVKLSILEFRIHCSAGYRIYAHRQGNKLIIMLCAGTKDSQQSDINTAEKICLEYYNVLLRKI